MALPYVGNADFRGYLNYLGQNGNAQAKNALYYTGNDGGIDSNALNSFYDSPTGSTLAGSKSLQAARDYVSGAYDTYRALAGGNVLGASTTVSNVDPQAEAYYGNQIDRIQNQIGTLRPQLQTGRQNIEGAFNDQNAQLDLSQSRGTRDYNSNRTNTITDQQNAKGAIDTSVRQNNTALLRLLGRAGSGNSSAAQVLAPYAAARAGSQQRQQVQTQYGRNLQGLDTNFNDFVQNLDISRGDLRKQRDEQENQLESGINQTRASLLSTLADLVTQRGQAGGKSYTDAYAGAQPYVSQADSLIRGLVNLSRQYENPALKANPVAYNAPELAAYNFDPTGAPTAGGEQPVYADQLTPYSLLFGQDRRNKLLGAA